MRTIALTSSYLWKTQPSSRKKTPLRKTRVANAPLPYPKSMPPTSPTVSTTSYGGSMPTSLITPTTIASSLPPYKCEPHKKNFQKCPTIKIKDKRLTNSLLSFLYPYTLPLITYRLPTALFEPTYWQHRTNTPQTLTVQRLTPPLTSYLLPQSRPFTTPPNTLLLPYHSFYT